MIYALIDGIVHEEHERPPGWPCNGCANYEENRDIDRCYDVPCSPSSRADGKTVVFVRWVPHD